MNIKYCLIIALFWFIYDRILWFITDRICARKANYECKNCNNWACTKYLCEKYKGNKDTTMK